MSSILKKRQLWTSCALAFGTVVLLQGCGGGGGGDSSSSSSTEDAEARRVATTTGSRIVATNGTTGTTTYYTLSASVTGSGTVTSNPTGVTCGTDCSESYLSATSVTLTAAPGTGYTFGGWSGACTGTTLTCTVSMTAAKTVTALFNVVTATDTSSSTDLCAGLVTDKANHAMTALAKPAVGAAVTDPEFKTTIRRLTNSGTGNVIKTAYSTIPAWNADESYIILYHTRSDSSTAAVTGGAGHHLYNGKTYSYIKKLDIDPPDLEQFYWDAKDPDLLYYVNGSNQLIRLHVASGTKDVVYKFTCSSQVTGGGDPMYTSWDSDLIGLSCNGNFFSYRKSTNTVGTSVKDSTGSGLAPIASPSGKYLYAGLSGGAKVYDTNMNLLRTLPLDGDTHASLGKLADGTDVFVGVEFDGTYQGTLIVGDLTGATAPRVIIGEKTGYPYPPSGTHVNATAFKRPGWTAVSVVGDTSGKTVLNQELLLVNANSGGSVCRVAHHRSYGKEGKIGYWAEPHPVLSPSGTRILFTSDWGNSGSVDTYVVELPSYK